MKILMVCLGNICRSPLAEGIMQRYIQAGDLPWEVDSAGTGHWHVGQLPDPRSIDMARRRSIDITNQRARQFQPSDLDKFDHVLVMDTWNRRDVLAMANTSQQAAKVKLILDYTHPGEEKVVPDPYHNNDGFEEVFNMLDEACRAFIEVHRS